MGKAEFHEERWSLAVTFDPADRAHLENGADEAYSFAKYAADSSGALHEEIPVFIKWEKDAETKTRTVTVTSDVLDYLGNLQQWVTFHTIPLKVILVRNETERDL